MTTEDIEKVLAELRDLKCKTQKDVEDARVRFLGKKGEVTALFDEFHEIDKDKKKEFGRTLNELKHHGAELMRIAEEKNINFLFEASVGGGIPIIRPLNQCITSDEVYEITGILNG